MTIRDEIRLQMHQLIEDICNDRPVRLSVREQSKERSLKINGQDSGRGLIHHVKLMSIVDDLLKHGNMATKREIYYQNESIFKNQQELDRALDRLARTLRVPRDELGIVAGSKGVVFGQALSLVGEQGEIPSKARNIPVQPRVACMTNCKFVLVVEKEAAFQTIVHDSDYLQESLGPFVLVTGKGYPCMASRALVAEIGRKCAGIPIYALVDFDPYGLEIALQYHLGSTTLPEDQHHLSCPSLKYLGATFRDIDCYGGAAPQLEWLSDSDRDRAEKIKAKARVIGWTELESSATKMLDRGVKAELEVISGAGNYFTRSYLLDKLTVELAPLQS